MSPLLGSLKLAIGIQKENDFCQLLQIEAAAFRLPTMCLVRKAVMLSTGTVSDAGMPPFLIGRSL
jgi:hypothetical protein